MTTTTDAPTRDSLGPLAESKYLSLTSFKRDGTAVATPVWVVSDDGNRLLVWTAADSWKAKRIRRDHHVSVAACGVRGAVHGPSFEADAIVLADTTLVESLIRRKYGLVVQAVRILSATTRLLKRQPAPDSVTIAIVAR